MSYLYKKLFEGEKILYSANVSSKALIAPYVLSAILIYFMVNSVLYHVHDVRLLLAVGCFMVFIYTIPTIIGVTLEYFSGEYVITNNRIISKIGFLSKTIVDILPEQIQGIELNQSLFGSIFNYGSIKIQGIGGKDNEINWIASPQIFRDKIQVLINAVQK